MFKRIVSTAQKAPRATANLGSAHNWLAGFLLVLTMCACDSVHSQAGGVAEVTIINNKEEATPQAPWPPKTWVNWLQHMQPTHLAGLPVDLVVIDRTADGSDNTAYARETISALKKSGKNVLCYFSIGEAEEYRSYWKASWKKIPPVYLGPENPAWRGNYKVRYWHPQWWEDVLQPYLDNIIQQGFDGVYLDIVDAYWFWHEEKGMKVRTTADRMIDLVLRIAKYARSKSTRGDTNRFIVCPQNAEGIIDDGSPEKVTMYLENIDCIGVESLFFNAQPTDRTYRTRMLRRFADAGRTVLNIEYIESDRREEYRQEINNAPFPVVGYIAHPDASLAQLGQQP